jgi:hypothetical protein
MQNLIFYFKEINIVEQKKVKIEWRNHKILEKIDFLLILERDLSLFQ